MIFSSLEFLFGFLPLTLAVSWLAIRVGGQKALLVWLVAASIGFYGRWHLPDLLVLGASVAVNFGIGQVLYRRAARPLLVLGIAFNLILLGYFKYAGFLAETVNAVLGTHYGSDKLALPLAISFITFQKIAYLIDVFHRRTSDRSLLSYLFFASFFPQLIAGPIVHHREIVPQLRSGRFGHLTRDGLSRGAAMFSMGLYKKVMLADGMATFADAVFNASAAPTLVDAWGGALAYAFQIYFDFSGYTDMALGLGLMFGLRLPVNFNSPYKATSIIDFWRRWHITLSHFLRDCLYIPLGGNRHGVLRRHVSLMVTMLLGGLWHGAGWTFVAWGGLHGGYLVVNHLWRGLRGERRPGVIGRWAGRVLTLAAVVVAWVFFRADSFGRAWEILGGMAGANGWAPQADVALLDSTAYVWEAVLLGVVWLLPNTQEWLTFRRPLSSEPAHPPLTPTGWGKPLWRWRGWIAPPLLASALGIVVVVLLATSGRNQPFIYMIF
ncbi:membrane-bound O-acyltransferase family protein [Paramagnetospirillum kuznetsovii]|uniref:Probable alginate O-acetylase AlgI n=1 Tax=Paramagnetospirillum kuznetsovii TaxID=2053833 RepID=A0A364P2P3_9PROT|nr:MBOAT family protein [Paramagnetospirillum kuznetsovii]RAU23581.1 membrane-bound O-acyltransferase family protein [Paramagnetospirillum kuznetsovii]